MRTPLVTVILPAKDAGAYIGTTLETLTRQFDDLGAVKLVAIDDGSRDDTGALMRRYAERFPRAEVLRNESARGLATARNQGLPHVEGEAFCFLDGDDWMQPRRLEVLASRLRELDCDFVRTDHVTVRGGTRALVRAPYPWRDRVAPPRDAILPEHESTMVDYPYAWAGLFHRRLIDRGLAAFTEGLFTAEDRPWIWRLHLHAESFAVVDAPALLYRRGVATSLTQTRDRRQLDFARAMDEVISLVERDREAERFLPKAVWTVLALSSHHLVRARRMSPQLRGAVRAGILRTLRRLPADEVAVVLSHLDGPRRRVLARVLRQAGRAG
ncbi:MULTISPECIES: glycosyltransferase family 2 protein [unclassified Microbacterium]|uniref:glycosyltransferase family 2 protein n=1 Tax=Microbacterium TaxID=33882 RepID=UPI000DE2315E|nr:MULTISPECIES: glycosyltransferase family 2 protein [unclassified Microbacterium]NYF27121.1 glycosyltransferase involved in cell wall biosynthesis [Microbacterium sp. JAI119]RBO73449.1 glycosyltransferase family 2 protein [Microbacterium sp. H6]